MTAPTRRAGIVAGDDAFSRAVSAVLRSGFESAEWALTSYGSAAVRDHERVLMDGDVTVVVLDRYEPGTVERFDRAAHGTLRDWLCVAVRYPYVWVGPYVAPYQGACHRCLRMRMTQHGGLDATAERSASTPGGWAGGVSPQAELVAAGAALGLVLAGSRRNRGGDMVLVHADGLPVSRLTVVGRHLCTRCGDRSGERAPARDNARLRAILPTAGGHR
jgi:bacteriocin biosynthesis cyclodehydratase domain-containing protein